MNGKLTAALADALSAAIVPAFVAVSAVALTPAPAYGNSPYISEVYEYVPAPGQFINTLPEFREGDTSADILSAAREQLVGAPQPGMICLGAFGGYVVFGFDHPVANIPDEYDFKIYGNALISSQEPYGGNCEPGVVWVSIDSNGNGLPDDQWYQLAGSEYRNPATTHSFRIVYHRPDASHQPVAHPTDKSITDTEYIRWTSDDPTRSEGYIYQNRFHSQSYWPEWIPEATLEFEGTLLPDNAVDLSGKGTSWLLRAFGEGYADNLPNSDSKGFRIDWAVDGEGQPVSLPYVDFVKVQSGMLQNCGWLGETSTEVCGAEDLHPKAEVSTETAVNGPEHSPAVSMNLSGNLLSITAEYPVRLNVMKADGTLMLTRLLPSGLTVTDLGGFGKGMYIIEAGSASCKTNRSKIIRRKIIF